VELPVDNLRLPRDGRPAVAVEGGELSALAVHRCLGVDVVQSCQVLQRSVVIASALDANSTLGHCREHVFPRDYFGAPDDSKALETTSHPPPLLSEQDKFKKTAIHIDSNAAITHSVTHHSRSSSSDSGRCLGS